MLSNLYEKNIWKYTDQGLLLEELIKYKKQKFSIVERMTAAFNSKIII